MRGKARALIREMRKVANAEAESLSKEIEVGRKQLGLSTNVKTAAARVGTRSGVAAAEHSSDHSAVAKTDVGAGTGSRRVLLTKSASTPNLRAAASGTFGVLPGAGSLQTMKHSTSAANLHSGSAADTSLVQTRAFASLSGHPDMTLADLRYFFPDSDTLGALGTRELPQQSLTSSSEKLLQNNSQFAVSALTRHTMEAFRRESERVPQIVRKADLEKLSAAREEARKVREEATAAMLRAAVPAMTLTARTLQLWRGEQVPKPTAEKTIDGLTKRLTVEENIARTGLSNGDISTKGGVVASSSHATDSAGVASSFFSAYPGLDVTLQRLREGKRAQAGALLQKVKMGDSLEQNSVAILSPNVGSGYPGLDSVLQQLRQTKGVTTNRTRERSI